MRGGGYPQLQKRPVENAALQALMYVCLSVCKLKFYLIPSLYNQPQKTDLDL